MEQTKIETKVTNHIISLSNRKNMQLTGILEVVSSTEKEVALKTECGNMLILGEELCIEELSVNDRKLSIKGTINELKYNANKKPLLSKIFK